jgi:hypothetical protein
VIALQLILTNIRWINAALMAAILGVGFGLSGALVLGPSSWNTVFISLGIATVLALLTIYLSSPVDPKREMSQWYVLPSSFESAMGGQIRF